MTRHVDEDGYGEWGRGILMGFMFVEASSVNILFEVIWKWIGLFSRDSEGSVKSCFLSDGVEVLTDFRCFNKASRAFFILNH